MSGANEYKTYSQNTNVKNDYAGNGVCQDRDSFLVREADDSKFGVRLHFSESEFDCESEVIKILREVYFRNCVDKRGEQNEEE